MSDRRPRRWLSSGFLLQDHNPVFSVSTRDTFPGFPHVRREATGHVLQEAAVMSASRAESQEQENRKENGHLTGAYHEIKTWIS